MISIFIYQYLCGNTKIIRLYSSPRRRIETDVFKLCVVLL